MYTMMKKIYIAPKIENYCMMQETPLLAASPKVNNPPVVVPPTEDEEEELEG